MVLLQFVAMEPFKWFIDLIKKEWDVIREIPFTMTLIVIGALLIGYLINKWIFKEHISQTRELISIQNDRNELNVKELERLSDSAKKESLNLPEESLEGRTKRLSSDILIFLLNRRWNEPPLPRQETWNSDAEKMVRYSMETMNLYSLKFGAKVIAIRNQLSENGLQDEQLDQIYEHPTNSIGIRIVAERIGALAEQFSSMQD